MSNTHNKALPTHWFFWLLVILLVVASAVTANTIYTTLRDVFVQPESELDSSKIVQPVDEIPFQNLTIPLQTTNRPTAQEWDGKSRLNLLLLGVDDRTWMNNQGPPRADTIILVTIDPETQSGKILSIPRDLWVAIPGLGEHKINQAYSLGESQGLAIGGPGLTLATVEALFDISIPYYIQINFEAFVHIIDEIGGVKINVPDTLVIDPLQGKNNKTLEPGIQTLSGDLALAYARARNTIGSDFDRSHRQQQVIYAALQRMTDLNLIPTLISKAPDLYQEVARGVQTNLSIQQLAQLAQLGYKISPANLKSMAIGPSDVINSISFDGLSILLPIPNKIQTIKENFLSSTTLQETAPVETIVDGNNNYSGEEKPSAVVENKNARVALQNGTLVSGLASETQNILASYAITIAEVGNADRIYVETIIIDYTNNPNTVNQLMTVLHVAPQNVFNRYDPSITVDILVILGENWSNRDVH
ncbi:MAG: LCP family protein [Chloroflexi bacterium]|nr:LCP family protein [Chloroflexota bacterium]